MDKRSRIFAAVPGVGRIFMIGLEGRGGKLSARAPDGAGTVDEQMVRRGKGQAMWCGH